MELKIDGRCRIDREKCVSIEKYFVSRCISDAKYLDAIHVSHPSNPLQTLTYNGIFKTYEI